MNSTCITFPSSSEHFPFNSEVPLYNFQGQLIKPIVFTDGSFGLNMVAARSLLLVLSMSLILNFTFQPVYDNSGWIEIGEDGSLQGSAKLIQSNSGDLLCQTHELTLERAQKLDFLFPTMTHREEAFLEQPSTIYENILFLRPFSSELLKAFASTILLLGVMMYLVLNSTRSTLSPLTSTSLSSSCSTFSNTKASPKNISSHHRSNENIPSDRNTKLPEDNDHTSNPTNNNNTAARWLILISILIPFSQQLRLFAKSILWIISLLTQQGWDDEGKDDGVDGMEQRKIKTKPISFHLINLCGLFLSQIVSAIYSAKLISIIKSTGDPIKSLEDILRTKMDVFIDTNSQNAQVLAEELMPNLGLNESQLEERILSTTDGLLKISEKRRERRHGKVFFSYRFYMDNAARDFGDTFAKSYCQRISSVALTSRKLQVYNGMFVKKGSSLRFKNSFRYSLIRVKEVGLMRSYLQSEVPPGGGGLCMGEKQGQSEIESLPFSVTASCFFLLLFGVVGAIVALIAELFMH